MKVTGTVTIQNRLAHCYGFGSSSQLGRPCKGIVQIRNRSDGRQVLVISTRKEVGAQEFDVRTIQNVRAQFIAQGIATIEIRDPPLNIMLRECNKDELNQLIQSFQAKSSKKPVTPTSSSDKVKDLPKGNTETKDLKVDENTESPGSLRRSTGSHKRARSPELSRSESNKIRKCLTTNEKKLTIKSRATYPQEFHSKLEEIRVLNIGLRKIDLRWTNLKYLTTLEVRGNLLSNIDALCSLRGALHTLILAQNNIEKLKDNFFSHPVLNNLLHLDLSQNRLIRLPNSIEDLCNLRHANLSANKLKCLPFNLKWASLRHLDISKNDLSFIPSTLTRLELNRLDMSENPALFKRHPSCNIDFVGYNDVPTLFESACEVAMNVFHKSKGRTSAPSYLPELVQQYLKSGKYCFRCGMLSLRYKIIHKSEMPRSFCTGTMSNCVVSPITECTIKVILCYACDHKYGWIPI